MFNADYIVEQSTAIHADNRANGWWDQPRPAVMLQGLITSEMYEAFEALRKARRAQPQDVKNLFAMLANGVAGAHYAPYYATTVKDTVEAELAGTCIRTLDAIGGRIQEGGGKFLDTGMSREDALDLDFIAIAASTRIDACLDGAVLQDNEEYFAEMLIGMVPPALGIQTAASQYTAAGVCPMITELNSYVETLKNMALLARWYGIDLEAHIALEVAYNRTRGHKHGNNVF